MNTAHRIGLAESEWFVFRLLIFVGLLLGQPLISAGAAEPELQTVTRCQPQDSLHRFRVTQIIAPAALIAVGVTALHNDWLESRDQDLRDALRSRHSRCRIDNATMFLTPAAAWGLNLMGVQAKHRPADLTVMMGTSYAFLLATTQVMKHSTQEWRPDGTEQTSFPSTHTAVAFCGAYYLWREYKSTSPWIGIAGYAVATGTGYLRIYNNRHWTTDVLAGAGMGILSAQVGYWIYPYVQRRLLKTSWWRQVAAVPSYENGSLCLNVGITL